MYNVEIILLYIFFGTDFIVADQFINGYLKKIGNGWQKCYIGVSVSRFP